MAAERTLLRQLRSRWAIGVLGILGTTTAHALPQFEIPSDCGTIEEYRTGIRARLGAEATALLQALSVRIAKNDNGYRLDVRLHASTRHIEDQDCRALLRAATVIAIALWESPESAPNKATDPASARTDTHDPQLHDPASESFDSASAHPASSQAVLPPPLPALVPEATQSAESAARDPSAPKSWRIGLEGRAGAIAGLVPGVSAILGLEPSLRYGSLGFGVGLDYVFPREEVDPGGYGVRVSAFRVAPTVTWSLRPRVGLQVGVAGSFLTGTGRGSERDQTDHAWTLGPQVGIQVKVLKYRGAWIALGGMTQLELIRPRFEIRAYGEVFRPFWVNGSVNLSMGVAFD
jgi:hypothetical protein